MCTPRQINQHDRFQFSFLIPTESSLTLLGTTLIIKENENPLKCIKLHKKMCNLSMEKWTPTYICWDNELERDTASRVHLEIFFLMADVFLTFWKWKWSGSSFFVWRHFRRSFNHSHRKTPPLLLLFYIFSLYRLLLYNTWFCLPTV